MIHIEEFLWCFSIISFCFQLLHGFTRVFYMTLTCNTSSSYSSSSSSSSLLPPTLPWMHFCSSLPVMNGGKTRALKNYSKNTNQEVGLKSAREEEVRNSFCFEMKGSSEEKSLSNNSREVVTVSTKAWKRPSRISIPKPPVVTDFRDLGEVLDNKDFEIQGRDFFLASRRGRRAVMEDGFSVITDILGDPKQAFFGVFDGHGGRPAVDYATENLGKNIVVAIGEVGVAEDQVEQAIRNGYLTTDKDFLSKGQCSGVCAATVILKDGELYVANAGDCRVVLSRKGVGDALTSDHRVNREDELFRIQNLGGYVSCRSGIWRAQDTLAVSRAIGDLNLKEWIISEPEIKKLHLTSDCDFLIVASDGLWDKVSNQEAVDVISRHKITLESCKKLVDMSSSRGNKDDTTVMVVNLQNFVRSSEPS